MAKLTRGLVEVVGRERRPVAERSRGPSTSGVMSLLATALCASRGVADLVSPALHRFRSVISGFRPASGTESSEAALRRLLASCTIGCFALTSDDPAPGSVTESSRIARPPYAPKALGFVSLMSSSSRFYLET